MLRVFALVAFVSTRFPSITIVYFTFPIKLAAKISNVMFAERLLRKFAEKLKIAESLQRCG